RGEAVAAPDRVNLRKQQRRRDLGDHGRFTVRGKVGALGCRKERKGGLMAENGTAYREAVGNSSFYPGGAEPVRANVPYTPVTIVSPAGRPNVPIVGVLVLVGLVLFMEHQRRRRGR